MRKIINAPVNVPEEALEGFVQAHASDYVRVEGVKGVRVKEPKDKVALVIGGGSGHEPMFAMFVGENLADASANGNIFASPDPNTILQTVRSVERGKGVLFVYGNYAGDNLNFDMAIELLEYYGIGSAVIPPHHSNQAVRPVYHPAVAGGDCLFVMDARKLNGDQDFVKATFKVFLIRV